MTGGISLRPSPSSPRGWAPDGARPSVAGGVMRRRGAIKQNKTNNTTRETRCKQLKTWQTFSVVSSAEISHMRCCHGRFWRVRAARVTKGDVCPMNELGGDSSEIGWVDEESGGGSSTSERVRLALPAKKKDRVSTRASSSSGACLSGRSDRTRPAKKTRE